MNSKPTPPKTIWVSLFDDGRVCGVFGFDAHARFGGCPVYKYTLAQAPAPVAKPKRKTKKRGRK